MAQRKHAHIVSTQTHWGECLHCGAKLDYLRTVAWTPIDIILKAMRSFERQHANCPKPANNGPADHEERCYLAGYGEA